MNKKEWIPYIIALVALVIGAIYDYQITDALYAPDHLVAIFFERIILLPLIFMVTIAMCMQARVKASLWYLLLGYASSVYVVFDGLHRFVKLHTIGLLICLGIALLLTLLCYLIIMKLPYRMVLQTHRFFLFYTCVFLTSVAITTIIKSGWGRIRYRDMNDIREFCVWYQPCLRYGSTSFPSGHTTSFCAILCFLQWNKEPSQRVGIGRYIIITILVIMMPVTRMMMGAHFLSDTAMGFIITYSCYLLYRNQFLRGGKRI